MYRLQPLRKEQDRRIRTEQKTAKGKRNEQRYGYDRRDGAVGHAAYGGKIKKRKK